MRQSITTSAYTFENIIERNLFYADKTEYFYSGVERGGNVVND
jgi:hypothetical protein